MRKIFYAFPLFVRAYHFTLAFLGAFLYRFPSRHLFVIGITGTKGKTTTAELINAILEEAGKKTALLSSVWVKVGTNRDKNKTGNTMPGRFFIHSFLRRAVRERCTYAVVEVTSQGVAFSRHRFVRWKIAVLTNISPEHIEAHGSFENYRAAKLMFLRKAADNGAPIFINASDGESRFFVDALGGRNVFLYSTDLLRESFTATPALAAAFYKENVAAAVAVARQIGISEGTIERALRKFKGVPGRMEFVSRPDGRPLPFEVVIDYAHTPDSLRAVYLALRERLMKGKWDEELRIWKQAAGAQPQVSRGKLLCVLGAAGGGRDTWKRPEMGKIASEFCDAIFLTDEDSYDESPATIIAQIKSGVLEAKMSTTKEILDRRAALGEAIASAREGDIVVATGKGSEEWIHSMRGRNTPWHEREVVQELLQSTPASETPPF